jgi:predicted nucleic acid-binding protein
MDRLFLDTNVILRYLTRDDPLQAARAYALFQEAAQGQVTLVMSEAIILELVHVLSSRVTYNLPRQQVATHIGNVLSLSGVTLPHKRTYLRALSLWESSSVDFADALSVAHMERLRIATIASFDRDFDRFPGITRKEP